MKLIVGLGNPGKEYDKTRHNVGFMVVDNYIEHINISDNEWKKKFNSLYLQTDIRGEKVIFMKPLTYMNLSGQAVKEVVDYFKIDISDILVVSDDLDLLVGNFKLREAGSSGGHNGLKNIALCLGTDKFKRLKVGISKNSSIDIKDYVLGKISRDDLDTLNGLFKELNNVIDDYFVLPFSDLMSKYNRKNRWFNEFFGKFN